jgi:putative sigma-54 modulation protein
MDIQVRGNGVSVTDDLQKFITKRTAHLDRVVDKVDDAKLELRKVRNRAGPSTVVAQITIRSGRNVLRAEEEAADANIAIDKAFSRLERQIHRVRDKRSRRRAAGQRTIREAVPAGISDMEPELEPDEENGVGDLVRTKRFGVKPMDVEEAIEQMELLGHDFFLFHYADEDIPSVVYRRRDGAYGLLIPRE